MITIPVAINYYVPLTGPRDATLSGLRQRKITVPTEEMNDESEEPIALRLGNRAVVTDHYFHSCVANELTQYRYKVFVRLGAAKKTEFRNVSFQHCFFENCYLPNCVFDGCDFTGCRFIGTNFHQTTFTGCTFWYALFERTEIDDDILISEAPLEENLRARFARTLRLNFAQLGDAKAVNRAMSVELDATRQYLFKSWSIHRSNYYRKKYPGLKRVVQFLRWIEFKLLDFIWGNGESIIKLARSIAIIIVFVTIYDATLTGNALDPLQYWNSFVQSPGIFLGVLDHRSYSPFASALIGASRYVSLALLTALLIKRFGRR